MATLQQIRDAVDINLAVSTYTIPRLMVAHSLIFSLRLIFSSRVMSHGKQAKTKSMMML